MKFEYAGCRYKIWFKYEGTVRRETLCFIDLVDDEKQTTFSVGSAVCAPSDRFCKETGRKVALTKALKDVQWRGALGPELKEYRRLAWRCYLNRSNTGISEARA